MINVNWDACINPRLLYMAAVPINNFQAAYFANWRLPAFVLNLCAIKRAFSFITPLSVQTSITRPHLEHLSKSPHSRAPSYGSGENSQAGQTENSFMSSLLGPEGAAIEAAESHRVNSMRSTSRLLNIE